jgi:hypothetical protein
MSGNGSNIPKLEIRASVAAYKAKIQAYANNMGMSYNEARKKFKEAFNAKIKAAQNAANNENRAGGRRSRRRHTRRRHTRRH